MLDSSSVVEKLAGCHPRTPNVGCIASPSARAVTARQSFSCAREEPVYQPCRTHRTVASRAVSNASDAIRTLSIATDEGSIECVVLACVDARRMPLTLFVFDGRPRLDDD